MRRTGEAEKKLQSITNEAPKSAKKGLLLAQIAGIISNVGEKKRPSRGFPLPEFKRVANRKLE